MTPHDGRGDDRGSARRVAGPVAARRHRNGRHTVGVGVGVVVVVVVVVLVCGAAGGAGSAVGGDAQSGAPFVGGGGKRRALRGCLSSALLRPWRFFQPPSDPPPAFSSSSPTTSPVLVARELEVEASTASGDFFGERLFVPTAAGFYDDPGCVESFGATVAVATTHRNLIRHHPLLIAGNENGNGNTRTLDEIFENAALEFGGLRRSRQYGHGRQASPTR